MELNSMLSKAKYTHKEKVSKEAKSALSKYPNLNPRSDTYVFDNGETRNLVCLDGTIPVMYKSNSYNIPMQFWMPINFPYERPLVFVRPTHQMVINPSNVVDSSGTVKLPYLDDWTYDRSNLINLIEILQENFAKKSPVYSKSINAAVNAANSSSTSLSQSASGHALSTAAQPSSTTQSSANAALAAQPVPAYTNPPQAYAPPTSGNFWNPYWGSQPQAASAGYPALPGAPATAASTAVPPPSYLVPSQSASTVPPPYNNATAVATGNSYLVPVTSSSSNPVYSVPIKTSGSSALTRTGTVTGEHIKASLLSAIVDKMNRKISDRVGQVIVEVESLRASQSEMEQGRVQLDSLLVELKREADRWTDSLVQLKSRNKQLEEMTDRLKTNELIPADDVLTPTAPLYKQLLESYAEEQAYEDAIYCLGDALHRETIDVDVYIKQIRQLARKQFYAKLIVQKCREKAGLPTV